MRVCSSFFLCENLSEYQGSQNKYHDHIFSGNEIKGQMIAVAYSTWDTLFTGAFTANKGAMDRGLAAGTSFGGIYGMFSAVPSGSISKDGLTGQASKPATVAFMWILRFA